MMSDPTYDSKGMRVYTKAEIESHAGKYDKDGFYIMEDKSFFDHHGYYFD